MVGAASTPAAVGRVGWVRAALWVGLAAAPLAWSLYEVVGYVIVANGCARGVHRWSVPTPTGVRAAVAVLTGVCLATAIGGIRAARRARMAPPLADEAEGQPRAFLSHLGVLLATLCLVGIAYAAIGPFALPCP